MAQETQVLRRLVLLSTLVRDPEVILPAQLTIC